MSDPGCALCPYDARFTPKTDMCSATRLCPLCANNGHWPITSGQTERGYARPNILILVNSLTAYRAGSEHRTSVLGTTEIWISRMPETDEPLGCA